MELFKKMGVREDILSAIHDMGFIKPTGIQEKVIPHILKRNGDLIGLAQTGTGKTAGFGIPVIQQTDINNESVQTIVLCPTRELCLQITKDIASYSKYVSGYKCLAVYGGANINAQISGLKSKPQLIVGTPGRTLDLIKRKKLKLSQVKTLILDEADEMLNMGFREDLDLILKQTPSDKISLLFSATLPAGIKQLTKKYMKNPVEIVDGEKNKGTDNVEHEVYTVKASDRYLALKRLLDINPGIYGIVFCRTRAETREVARKLIEDNYPADALHGELSQAQRDHVMMSFRNRNIQMLVATDVAARGLDVENLTHILNYNLPDDPEIYIHRSGRTGRAGKKGISMIITHAREGNKIRSLERILGHKIMKKKVPSGQEIVEKRLYNTMNRIENTVPDEEKIAPYWNDISNKLNWLDRDELLKRIVYVEFERYLDYYKKAGNLNVDPKERPGKSKKIKSDYNTSNSKTSNYKNFNRKEEGFARFFINIGEKQNIKASKLIGLINDQTRDRNLDIGKIDVFNNFSFFEVDENHTEKILAAFKNSDYKGTSLKVEISKPDSKIKDKPAKIKDKSPKKKKRKNPHVKNRRK